MHVAIIGCGHGEIDKIYEVVADIEVKRNIKVDIVLCCGDFQSVRNMTDLRCMACPIKYQQMHDFHRYYSGEKTAPKLTLFIGGNHEASNFLQELPFGGWVAPNIYYLGHASVVKFGSLRIAGISGIYKGQDYIRGRYELPPYNQDAMRSVYHYRNLDFFRLKQIKGSIDIVLSHDWPKGIHNFGDVDTLLRQKPFFRDDIMRNELGSRPLFELLEYLRPEFWFSAHMHCKFPAIVHHPDPEGPEGSETNKDSEDPPSIDCTNMKSKCTRFLALDKILPRRQFLQIVEIPPSQEEKEMANKEEGAAEPQEQVDHHLSYDLEWLAILRSTNGLTSVKNGKNWMPGPGGNSRYEFTPTEEEVQKVLELLGNDAKIPSNFEPTAPAYQNGEAPGRAYPQINPQTTLLCDKLNITDPISLITSIPLSNHNPRDNLPCPEDESQMNITLNNSFTQVSLNPEEIELDLGEEGDDDGDGGVDDVKRDGQRHDESSPTGSSLQLPIRSKLNLPPPKDSSTTTLSSSSPLTEINPSDQLRRNERELEVFRSLFPEMDLERRVDTTGLSPPENDSSPSFSIDRRGNNETESEQPQVKRRRNVEPSFDDE